MSNPGDDWLDDIAARLQREAKAGAVPRHEVPLREVLRRFGFQKRGSWINSRIEDALQARGLTMSPPIGEPWYVDETVSITRGGDTAAREGDGPEDPTVRVEILDAADQPLVTVTPDASLESAMTLMQMHDYSQLPVWSTPSSVKGMVSWKSIGRVHAHGAAPSRVGECMDRAHVIPVHTPLMEAVDTIYKHDPLPNTVIHAASARRVATLPRPSGHWRNIAHYIVGGDPAPACSAPMSKVRGAREQDLRVVDEVEERLAPERDALHPPVRTVIGRSGPGAVASGGARPQPCGPMLRGGPRDAGGGLLGACAVEVSRSETSNATVRSR